MKFPKLKSKAILAPMSGFTDIAFRHLCKKYKAGLTYTEFVSTTAITRGNEKTLNMLRTARIESPKAVQIFGSNIDEILESAKFLQKKFDIIDLNCGCPSRKITDIGAGSSLLKTPKIIGKIIEALSAHIKKPITLKIRTGINQSNINAVEIAKIAEASGAKAIAVHGRTQSQHYMGEADWDIIKKVKASINIPVIGNGDINSPEIFKKRLEESGVDYIMIGRAALSNPYLFTQINDFLKKGDYKEKPQEIINQYLKLAVKYKTKFPHIKNHLMQFTKGIKNSAALRKRISGCKSMEELDFVE